MVISEAKEKVRQALGLVYILREMDAVIDDVMKAESKLADTEKRISALQGEKVNTQSELDLLASRHESMLLKFKQEKEKAETAKQKQSSQDKMYHKRRVDSLKTQLEEMSSTAKQEHETLEAEIQVLEAKRMDEMALLSSTRDATNKIKEQLGMRS